MTYPEARAYIESLQKRGWRLGLDRMQEILRRIDDPHVGQKFFHVAGTNGKGTVTAMIASVLTHAGFRTGSFFSPYVYEFRERIQVDGNYISESDVARLTAFLKPVSEELAETEFGGPTEFEFKTAMGFLYWKEQECDYVALEVGLGGRLDATNVVTPIVSMITEIGLDHQQYLGETIEEIAREKAGIIKPGVPVVCGSLNWNVLSVIAEVAEGLKSPFHLTPANVHLVSESELFCTTPTRGLGNKPAIQWETPLEANALTAETAIQVSKLAFSSKIVREGIATVDLPGRMEVFRDDPLVILDGAHNGQAIDAVIRTLRKRYPRKKWRVIYSAATGHNMPETMEPIKDFANQIYAAPMNHPRSIGRDELQRDVQHIYESVSAAVDAAMRDLRKGEALLVIGSFFLLSEAKSALELRLNKARSSN